MTKHDVQICVVGAGRLSSTRICPYLGLAGAELVGVCDLDFSRASEMARRYGGAAYASLDKMLDFESPDGVIVCVGAEVHEQLAQVIMRRRIPVYTEKPPALTSAGALQVARVSAEMSTLCSTAFRKRYSVAYDRAKEWLSGFRPSEHLAIGVEFSSGAYLNASESTSFLLDFAIHAIDLVSFLMGDVKDVFCFSSDERAWAVSLRFESGAVGTMSLTDGRSFEIPTETVELTVNNGNFMTIKNSSSWRITTDFHTTEWREPPTFVSSGDSGYETGHLSELEDFVIALNTGAATRSNIYESYKTMVLYEAIQTSARLNMPVRVFYESL